MGTTATLEDERVGIGGEELSLRSAPVQPSTWKKEDRSFEAVLSTETPVLVYDWRSGELVDEVLRAAGAEWPATGQVPLLDSHARYSVRSQLGSIREFAPDADAGELRGRLFISEVERYAETKVREGHVTDVSVGYRNKAVMRIESGETGTVEGKEYTAGERPLHVVTKWRLLEASLTPIGADELAKVRAAAGDGPAGPGLRDVLAGVQFLTEETTMAETKPTPAGTPAAAATPPKDGEGERQEPVIDLATEQERARAETIRTIAPRGLEAMADQLVLDGTKVETARAALLAAHAKRMTPAGTPEPEAPELPAKDGEDAEGKDKKARKLEDVSDDELTRGIGG